MGTTDKSGFEIGILGLGETLETFTPIRKKDVIYIITRGTFKDYGIKVVFSTKEKAEKWIKDNPVEYDQYRIEEYEVDTGRRRAIWPAICTYFVAEDIWQVEWRNITEVGPERIGEVTHYHNSQSGTDKYGIIIEAPIDYNNEGVIEIAKEKLAEFMTKRSKTPSKIKGNDAQSQ